MNEHEHEWMTVAEVAAELEFSRGAVYNWIEPDDGGPPKLTAHRFGGNWRVRRADLEAFVAAGRNVQAQAQAPEGVTT